LLNVYFFLLIFKVVRDLLRRKKFCNFQAGRKLLQEISYETACLPEVACPPSYPEGLPVYFVNEEGGSTLGVFLK
jgi:hypothetical protein